ncbi:MAG: hypothetical protein MHM6MM_004352 [Cercozoa sp. M6MM]
MPEKPSEKGGHDDASLHTRHTSQRLLALEKAELLDVEAVSATASSVSTMPVSSTPDEDSDAVAADEALAEARNEALVDEALVEGDADAAETVTAEAKASEIGSDDNESASAAGAAATSASVEEANESESLPDGVLTASEVVPEPESAEAASDAESDAESNAESNTESGESESNGEIDESNGEIDESDGEIDESNGEIDESDGEIDESNDEIDDDAASESIEMKLAEVEAHLIEEEELVDSQVDTQVDTKQEEAPGSQVESTESQETQVAAQVTAHDSEDSEAGSVHELQHQQQQQQQQKQQQQQQQKQHETDDEKEQLEEEKEAELVSQEEHGKKHIAETDEDEEKPPPTDLTRQSSCGTFQGPLRLMAGHHAIQGLRETMEDEFTLITHPQFNKKYRLRDEVQRSFYAVFDGHGGKTAAVYTSAYLHTEVANRPCFLENPRQALREGILKVHDDFVSPILDSGRKSSSGTCAIVAYVEDTRVVVANVGDSRAVLSRNGHAVPLSDDHKPDRPDELQRVREAGGMVGKNLQDAIRRSQSAKRGGGRSFSSCWHSVCEYFCSVPVPGVMRVFPGGLAISRSIGDLEAEFVVAEPEFFEAELRPEDEFLILACDGVWDVLTNQEAVRHVARHLSRGADAAAEALVDQAFAHGSSDNISVIVIQLEHLRPAAPADDTPAELTDGVVDGVTEGVTADGAGVTDSAVGTEDGDTDKDGADKVIISSPVVESSNNNESDNETDQHTAEVLQGKRQPSGEPILAEVRDDVSEAPSQRDLLETPMVQSRTLAQADSSPEQVELFSMSKLEEAPDQES